MRHSAAVRDLIREVVPQAEETMDYRMPTYLLNGAPLCAFASRKRYMCLCIHTRLIEKYRARFPGLSVGKECIRFGRLSELPLDAVRQVLDEAVTVERA